MMKHIALLSFICFLFGCRPQQQKQTQPPAPSIKCDWQGIIKNADTFRNINRYMSFEDSLCTGTDWGFNLKYYLNHDTVFIEDAARDNHPKYQYAILKLTNDSLVLLSPATKEKPADTVTLSKIRKKNTIKPSAIYFASSVCFGDCPSMYLKIDSSRTLAFFGEFFTDNVDGFSGKLTADQYETILDQINNLPVDSLKDFYHAPWTDDQTCGVAIESGGKLIKSTAYGSFKEPVELTILLDKLIDIYHQVSLHRDTTVTIDYFLTHPAAIPTTKLTTQLAEHK